MLQLPEKKDCAAHEPNSHSRSRHRRPVCFLKEHYKIFFFSSGRQRHTNSFHNVWSSLAEPEHTWNIPYGRVFMFTPAHTEKRGGGRQKKGSETGRMLKRTKALKGRKYSRTGRRAETADSPSALQVSLFFVHQVSPFHFSGFLGIYYHFCSINVLFLLLIVKSQILSKCVITENRFRRVKFCISTVGQLSWLFLSHRCTLSQKRRISGGESVMWLGWRSEIRQPSSLPSHLLPQPRPSSSFISVRALFEQTNTLSEVLMRRANKISALDLSARAVSNTLSLIFRRFLACVFVFSSSPVESLSLLSCFLK